MGCKYCDDSERMIQKEVQNTNILWWGIGQEITEEALQCCDYNLIVFIDRGYLRLANEDDCNCMDHGEKIKIEYCPMCGRKI